MTILAQEVHLAALLFALPPRFRMSALPPESGHRALAHALNRNGQV
jgi:hypothetical protein